MRSDEIKAIETKIFQKYNNLAALNISHIKGDLSGLIYILCDANLLSLDNIDNFDKAYECAIAVRSHHHDLYPMHRVLQYMNGGMGTLIIGAPIPKILTQSSLLHILKSLSTPYEVPGQKPQHLGSCIQSILSRLIENEQSNEKTLQRFTQNHYQIFVLGSMIQHSGTSFAECNTLIDASEAKPDFWKNCAEQISNNYYKSNIIDGILKKDTQKMLTTSWDTVTAQDDKPVAPDEPANVSRPDMTNAM